MKKGIALLLAALLLLLCSCTGGEPERKGESEARTAENALVVYFSHNDCIEEAAQYLAKTVGAEIAPIVPKKAYPEDEKELAARAARELAENERPKIAKPDADPDDFDIIFIGYPLWENTVPMPVMTFLEQKSVKEKAVCVFTVNEDGKTGDSMQAIADAWKYSQITDKFAFRDNDFEKWTPVFEGWFSKALFW